MNLLRMIDEGSTGAEVGVWEGRTSSLFLSKNPQVLYLVDPWKYDPTYPDLWWGGKGGRITCQEDMDALYQSVVDRLSDPRVQIIRKSSQEALQDVQDGILDWVFIDGNHEYDYVLADLRGWFEKLRPGGQLFGDDYSGWWPDVRMAVDQFLLEHPWIRPSFFTGAGKFRMVKPG